MSVNQVNTLYFPQVKRRQFGSSWYDYSGVVIQNLNETQAASINVYFYDRNGVQKTWFNDSIPAKSSHGYNTRYNGDAPASAMSALGTDFNGSVRVVSTGNQEIIGLNKTWVEGSVNALEMQVSERGGTATLLVPVVYRKTYNGQYADPQNDSAWKSHTGVIVHNLGGSSVNVTVRIYNQNGTQVTSFNDVIPANSPHGYNTRYYGDAPSHRIGLLGYNFLGSMSIESTNGQPLIALVDEGLETEAIYYYNADW